MPAARASVVSQRIGLTRPCDDCTSSIGDLVCPNKDEGSSALGTRTETTLGSCVARRLNRARAPVCVPCVSGSGRAPPCALPLARLGAVASGAACVGRCVRRPALRCAVRWCVTCAGWYSYSTVSPAAVRLRTSYRSAFLGLALPHADSLVSDRDAIYATTQRVGA